ncbi:MAG: hypothetical protein ACXW3F_13515 [Pyrinomonadaceae bacterium]
MILRTRLWKCQADSIRFLAIRSSVSSSASRKQHVESIKVTIAVTVYPAVAPEAIIVVVVAPPTIARDVATAVGPTSVPAAIASIVTIHELLDLLVLPAATSTPLRESKNRHRYQQN